MFCLGDDNELCGVGMWLNVYSFDKEIMIIFFLEFMFLLIFELVIFVVIIDGFEYLGCYNDNVL